MTTSHKHRFAPSKETEIAVAAGYSLGQLVFRELVAVKTPCTPMIVRFHDLVEKPFLDEVMKLCKGNVSLASKMLGLNRATTRRLCRRYGIKAGKTRGTGP